MHIEGVLTGTMINGLVPIGISGEKEVYAVGIRADTGAPLHRLMHKGAEGISLHTAQHDQTNVAP
jgi:hypothetical protein